MILLSFYSKIKNIRDTFIIFIVKKLFISNCITGLNFTCGIRSKCKNLSGKKENIIIGDNCELLSNLLVECNGIIKIGNYTTMRNDTRLIAVDRIEIGDYVIISNNVTIFDNNTHPTNPEKRIEMSKSGFYSDLWNVKYSDHAPIIIGDNVWIGERACILKGVTIGKGSIVAMNAVVTKDVPPYSVVAGNPAKVVKKLNE